MTADSDSGTGSAGLKEKRIRRCGKCGTKECGGKGGRRHCKSECMDCGRKDCLGRNVKTPDTPCSNSVI